MWQLYWPIAVAVVADVAYWIASKSTPSEMNPMATLVFAYVIGAIFSAVLYFVTDSSGNGLLGELKLANWSTIVIGLAVVGLEAGSIYMFRAGWDMSVGPMVKNAIIAVVLVVLGYLIYKEPVTGTKIAGIAVILVGLWLVNK